MLAILAQCETTMMKSVEVYNMNLKEQENYERLNERIGRWLIFARAVNFMVKSGSVMTSKGSGPCCRVDDTFVMLTKVMLLIICPSAFSAKI